VGEGVRQKKKKRRRKEWLMSVTSVGTRPEHWPAPADKRRSARDVGRRSWMTKDGTAGQKTFNCQASLPIQNTGTCMVCFIPYYRPQSSKNRISVQQAYAQMGLDSPSPLVGHLPLRGRRTLRRQRATCLALEG
jgi:hypothetical protein